MNFLDLCVAQVSSLFASAPILSHMSGVCIDGGSEFATAPPSLPSVPPSFNQFVAAPPELLELQSLPISVATPVATIPVATIPVATIPVATIPVATIPVATIPVATIPVATIPVATIPVATALSAPTAPSVPLLPVALPVPSDPPVQQQGIKYVLGTLCKGNGVSRFILTVLLIFSLCFLCAVLYKVILPAVLA